MRKHPPKYFAIIGLLIIAALILYGLQSCSTEKNFVKYHNKHDTTAAKYCLSWCPIHEKVTTRTVYKPGTPKIIKGEEHVIYANCDSAYQAAYDEMARSGKKDKKIVVKNIAIPIPTQVDTFFVDSTIVKESTAKLDIADNKINNLQIALAKQKDESIKTMTEKTKWLHRSMWLGGGYALMLIIFVGYKVLKKYIPFL